MAIVQQYVSRAQPPSGRETVPSGMAGIAAAPAEAAARMGGALTEFGARVLGQISQAEDAMELATLQGSFGDRKNALFNTLATTPDPAVREQLFNQAQQEAGTLTSKRPNVQKVFDAEKKLRFVEWQADFNTVNNRLRVQNVRDQYRLNYTRLLEQNNVPGANQLSRTAYANEVISQVQYEDDIANAPNESILAQMNKAAEEHNFGMVSTLAEQLKNPSGKQLKRKNTILVAAKQMQGDDGDAFSKSILKEMIDADVANMDALSRTKLAQNIKQRLADPMNPLSGAEARIMMNNVDSWEISTDVETDWPSYQTVRQLVGPVARGEMKLDEAIKTYYKESPKLARQERKELLEKIISAWEEKKDPAFARGLQTLAKWETDGILMPSDKRLKDELPPEQYEAYSEFDSAQQETYKKAYSTKRWRDYTNEFEAWYKEKPRTPTEVKEYLDEIIELPKAEAAKSFLTRVWEANAALGERWRTGKWPEEAKPQVGPLQPKKLNIDSPADIAIVKRYLFLAGGDRTRAEAMAKQDGYEW